MLLNVSIELLRQLVRVIGLPDPYRQAEDDYRDDRDERSQNEHES